jgi:hypothetical protein
MISRRPKQASLVLSGSNATKIDTQRIEELDFCSEEGKYRIHIICCLLLYIVAAME